MAAGVEDDGKVRLDKWLWAARFFKTRQLAHEALELGRVQVNGDRVKASRVVKEGDQLVMRINQLEYRVEVLALSTQRRPAKEAQLLYREDEASQRAREEQQLLLKAERASFPHGDGRPTKKARREIGKFKGQF
ncbi:tRNA synthetase RNA-binding protein [Chromobacterium sp. LK11]|nr:tRNA synthetase RNA-binding protein [Chromobacterium sp. LK11]